MYLVNRRLSHHPLLSAEVKRDNSIFVCDLNIFYKKSAFEWIIDWYRVKTEKKSGITNDANDWVEEVGNRRYILDLLLSIINVSVQKVDIVNSLPKLEFEE